MKETEIVIECAKLDGLTFCRSEQSGGVEEWHDDNGELVFSLKAYTTSRDAIVPTCAKQPKEIRDRIQARTTIFSTASEICQILLEETGKWH